MKTSIVIINDEFEYQQENCHQVDDDQELAWAAFAYLKLYLSGTKADREAAGSYYPWAEGWDPETPKRALVKAGAFIASELERANATISKL